MNPAIGVKEFVAILNETLNFAYPEVVVEGEVSGFKINQNKWVFFDLKDDEATLNCFMPIYQLKVPLEDGMQVRVMGSPRLTKWGKFSFTARGVELAGEGELRRAFELLKTKLETEGLFDPARRRVLPKFPRTIGLITSVQSAAYSDFMKILGERWGGVEVKVADVQVQGAPAPDQILAALDYFNQSADVEVLVLIRGGGSLEDLQAFNTEAVARGVAASRVPIIVGVGHEVDVSLADFAADLRAATPTDAARLVVPERTEIAQMLEYHAQHLQHALAQQIASLDQLLRRRVMGFERYLRLPAQDVERLQDLLNLKAEGFLTRTTQKLAHMTQILQTVSPQATLKRGYAIVTNEGRVVKSSNQVSANSELVIQLAAGKLRAKVENE